MLNAQELPRRYLNAIWQGSGLALLYRDANGQLQKESRRAEHVCYLERGKVTEDLLRQIRGSRYVEGVREEGDWLRVGWRARDLCRAACEPGGWLEQQGLRAYEADLSPVTRWLVDENPRIARPRRAYIDLETDSRVPMVRKEEARILCWTLVDHDTGEAVQGILPEDTDRAEVFLVEDLVDELLAYDQVVAWNGGEPKKGGDGFDFPVFIARCDRHRVQWEPRRLLWLDHLPMYQKMNMNVSRSGDEKQSFSLDAVMQSVLKRGKVAFNPRFTYEAWANPIPCASGLCMRCRACLAKYNLYDALGERDVELATGYLELHQATCETCGILPDSAAINPKSFVEAYVMRLGHERGMRFRTQFEIQGSEKFEGAWVMEPTKTGILRDVHVCDFASLYPSIIASWNMSPETLRADVPLRETNMPSYLAHVTPKRYPIPEGHCATPTDTVFLSSPRGVLAEAVLEVMSQRKVWKKKKGQFAPGTPDWIEADRRVGGFKIINNCFFGVASSPFSRLFERAIGEGITQTGAWLAKHVVRCIDERGWHALYGDTDSVFATGCLREEFQRFCDWANEHLFPPLLAELKCPDNFVKLAAEKGFDILIMIGKKRYAARYSYYDGQDADENSEPEVKGLEYKRGDVSRMARRMQARTLELLLGGGVIGKRRTWWDHDPATFRQLVLNWKCRVLEGPLDVSDYMESQTLQKPLSGYAVKLKKDGTPAAQSPHVRVGHMLRERGEQVGEGTRIDYVVVDGGKTPQEVAPADGFTGEPDRYYLWESQVYPPTQRILQECFPREDWKGLLRARPRALSKRELAALTSGQRALF